MTDAMVKADAAGSWRLGEMTVNRVGLGAMRLSQNGRAFDAASGPRDRRSAIRTLRTAVELGVNHIDTAAFYFSSLRSANELINSALAPYPDDLLIATKVGPSRDRSGAWMPPATSGDLRGQVEENLRQLGRDRLDLVYLRVQHGLKSVSDHVGALLELREAGLVREIGISGVTRAQMREAMDTAPIVSVQNRFGIETSDDSRDVLVECARTEIAFVPFFSIAGTGRHAGIDRPEHHDVLATARVHDASPAQVRLAWALHQGPHVLTIPGTGNPDHLADNVAAAALRLSADEVSRLDGLG
jgi:pyridoxine 4-dehydrogenase